MNPKTDSASSGPARKPRLSLFFATAAGAGYLPKAPGTWGSLVGILIYRITARVFANIRYGSIQDGPYEPGRTATTFHACVSCNQAVISVILALLGVWTASRVCRYTRNKDPQFVVIDEVSGQFFTYLFAIAPLNWKYLLLGFILFRVFDIWKPFPARQAESLPGGWGIMADDWIAAVYAALGIWIARGLGL
ncbi:MAG: phosphatidylglycerophosphatase A family protein [Candidatus Acidiferrales bacterium]